MGNALVKRNFSNVKKCTGFENVRHWRSWSCSNLVLSWYKWKSPQINEFSTLTKDHTGNVLQLSYEKGDYVHRLLVTFPKGVKKTSMNEMKLNWTEPKLRIIAKVWKRRRLFTKLSYTVTFLLLVIDTTLTVFSFETDFNFQTIWQWHIF